MKTITLYQCEICGSKYDDEADAASCESAGYIPDDMLPVGTMSAYFDDKEPIVLAIIEVRPGQSHGKVALCWAARDNIYGDNTGVQFCGFDVYPRTLARGSWPKSPVSHMNTPRFHRMVGYLKEAGIEPRIWVNGKSVLLSKEFPLVEA